MTWTRHGRTLYAHTRMADGQDLGASVYMRKLDFNGGMWPCAWGKPFTLTSCPADRTSLYYHYYYYRCCRYYCFSYPSRSRHTRETALLADTLRYCRPACLFYENNVRTRIHNNIVNTCSRIQRWDVHDLSECSRLGIAVLRLPTWVRTTRVTISTADVKHRLRFRIFNRP
jgi:hypothetical protein